MQKKHWMALVAASLSGFLFLSRPAQAQYNTNLVVNGDAEANAIADNQITGVAPTSWTRISGAFVAVTKTNNFWTNYLGHEINGPGVNSNFFVGGGSSSGADLQQTISLTAFSQDINSGLVTATLDARVGTFQNQGDTSQIVVTFLDSNAKSLGTLSTATTNNVQANKNSNNVLIYDINLGPIPSVHSLIPTGAASAQVDIIGIRHTGGDDDSYVDDVSLVLSRPATSVPEPGSIAMLVGFSIVGGGLLRRRYRSMA